MTASQRRASMELTMQQYDSLKAAASSFSAESGHHTHDRAERDVYNSISRHAGSAMHHPQTDVAIHDRLGAGPGYAVPADSVPTLSGGVMLTSKTSTSSSSRHSAQSTSRPIQRSLSVIETDEFIDYQLTDDPDAPRDDPGTAAAASMAVVSVLGGAAATAAMSDASSGRYRHVTSMDSSRFSSSNGRSTRSTADSVVEGGGERVGHNHEGDMIIRNPCCQALADSGLQSGMNGSTAQTHATCLADHNQTTLGSLEALVASTLDSRVSDGAVCVTVGRKQLNSLHELASRRRVDLFAGHQVNLAGSVAIMLSSRKPEVGARSGNVSPSASLQTIVPGSVAADSVQHPPAAAVREVLHDKAARAASRSPDHGSSRTSPGLRDNLQHLFSSHSPEATCMKTLSMLSAAGDCDTAAAHAPQHELASPNLKLINSIRAELHAQATSLRHSIELLKQGSRATSPTCGIVQHPGVTLRKAQPMQQDKHAGSAEQPRQLADDAHAKWQAHLAQKLKHGVDVCQSEQLVGFDSTSANSSGSGGKIGAYRGPYIESSSGVGWPVPAGPLASTLPEW